MNRKFLSTFFACIGIACFVPYWQAYADFRFRTTVDPTSVIEDSMCIPELNGQGCLHVDEDVANLNITVIGADGTTIAVYDAATEQEDIVLIGTYSAPSAINVRVSPQANGGADLTQMMFANSIYVGEDWIKITVSDGQVTIMDFDRWVYMADEQSVNVASMDADTVTAAAVATNAIGAPELATGAIGATVFSTGAITADAIATNAIGSLEIATNAIGPSELGTAAIDADSIAANAIGASEIATDAIGALEIAANAIGTSELATGAISSDELAASGVAKIWDEIIEDMGATYTARCLLAAVLAYTSGEWAQAGAIATYQDPGGLENRIVGTIGSPGFNTITITCP